MELRQREVSGCSLKPSLGASATERCRRMRLIPNVLATAGRKGSLPVGMAGVVIDSRGHR
jgi:hypothetical protein